jgi:hypothetical protein
VALQAHVRHIYVCNVHNSNAIVIEYGVYMSQLIRYAKACLTYDHFLVGGNQLKDKLMSQGFQLSRLQAVFPQILWSLQRSYLPTQRSYLPIQPFVGPHAV